jgi:hypothetical protein
MAKFDGNLKDMAKKLQEADKKKKEAQAKNKGTTAPKTPYKSLVPSGKKK